MIKDESMTEYCLQNFFFNSLNNELADELYYRVKNGFVDSFDHKIILFPQGKLSCDTYFNSFNLKHFVEHTEIKTVNLRIKASGKAIIRLYSESKNNRSILKEIYFDSDEVDIPINLEKSFTDDFVYFSIIALSDFCLFDAEWITCEETKRDISLAIVCTTFNREDDVLRLVDRLSSNELLRSKSKLYIINNGDDIALENTDYCSVFKNINSGGSGGFMRGLLEAQSSGEFTHVMFIDDDAYCDALSIMKSIALLEYDCDTNASVAGGMLYLSRPWMQYELGATLEDFNIRSNNPELDLRDKYSLFLNSSSTHCSYGPWWFFVFPIKDDLKYSFPFFVRGDDVTFSLRNHFHPYVMNGISSWQESFDSKISPAVEYLAFRSFIMISILFLDFKPSNLKLLKSMFIHVFKELCGFRYQIAEALCQAIEDVLKGPEFWDKYIEMKDHLKKVQEKAGAIQTQSVGKEYAVPRERYINKGTKLLAMCTFFGHLLPGRGVAVAYGLAARPYVALWKKVIMHYSPENQSLFIFKKDNARFFKLLIKTVKLLMRFKGKRNKLVKSYETSLGRFESSDFWREKLK